jgi:hypothetical protein
MSDNLHVAASASNVATEMEMRIIAKGGKQHACGERDRLGRGKPRERGANHGRARLAEWRRFWRAGGGETAAPVPDIDVR